LNEHLKDLVQIKREAQRRARAEEEAVAEVAHQGELLFNSEALKAGRAQLTIDVKVAREVEVAIITRENQYWDLQDSIRSPQGKKKSYGRVQEQQEGSAIKANEGVNENTGRGKQQKERQ